MTEPDRTDVPQAPPSIGPDSKQAVIPLAYARKDPSLLRRFRPLEFTVATVRRLLFAAGIGLTVAGLTAALNHGSSSDDPPTTAGLGAGFVALVIPFRGLSRWKMPPV